MMLLMKKGILGCNIIYLFILICIGIALPIKSQNNYKVKLTGKKMTDHIYYSYTGYPGGQREATPEILMKKSFNKHIKPGMHPLYLHVMKGMLPKNRIGRRLIENMHVYNGPNHPHEAQNPEVLDINKLK